ncbi:MAG: DUF420 domain-containing protein [Planctomycetota bacterium]
MPLDATRLPEINAGLNALAFVLIVGGLIAIKRGNEMLHKRLMLTAVGVSALFLVSYLYYHAQVGHVEFGGEGTIRTVYLVILFSHIVLAAVQVPLIVATVVLGLRDRRAAHRKVAKITAPVWLYVSVTGVVVYWMLYQM